MSQFPGAQQFPQQYPQQQFGAPQQGFQPGYQQPQQPMQQGPQMQRVAYGQGYAPGQFPFENNCSMVGQVYPNKWMPTGTLFTANERGGMLKINVKLRSQFGQDATKVNIQYVTVIAWGQTAQQLNTMLKAGQIIRFQAEYKQSKYKNRQTGHMVSGSQFVLRSSQGQVPVQVVGELPLYDEYNPNQPAGGYNNGQQWSQPQQPMQPQWGAPQQPMQPMQPQFPAQQPMQPQPGMQPPGGFPMQQVPGQLGGSFAPPQQPQGMPPQQPMQQMQPMQPPMQQGQPPQAGFLPEGRKPPF